MKPLIVLNFKTYKQALGENGIQLAKQLAVRSRKYEVILAPTLLTTQTIARNVKVPVFAQHASHAVIGASTGRIVAAELRQLGVEGAILNHSERKIPMKYLKDVVARCKEQKLRTIICASTLSEVKKIAELKPDYIAYEPKELIGGNISVTEAHPDIIVQAVDAVQKITRKTKVLCGAGIHSKEDVGHALLLGTKGVLIGHAIVAAKNPATSLREMLM